VIDQGLPMIVVDHVTQKSRRIKMRLQLLFDKWFCIRDGEHCNHSRLCRWNPKTIQVRKPTLNSIADAARIETAYDGGKQSEAAVGRIRSMAPSKIPATKADSLTMVRAMKPSISSGEMHMTACLTVSDFRGGGVS